MYCLLGSSSRQSPNGPPSYAYYRRLLHTLDTTLHSLSDAQIVAGLALLIVASFHASCISAYHYNVVCYLMIMSLITHTLVFVNIPSYCGKKKLWIGIARVLAILAILVLTGMLYKARDVAQSFPVDPSSLFIMPASCFVGNQTSVLPDSLLHSSSSNGTNLTSILEPSGTGEGSWEYGHIFIPVAIFVAAGLVFLLLDSIKALETTMKMATAPPHWRMWITLFIRVGITTTLTAIAIFATVNYYQFKNGFEIDAWYVNNDEDTASLSQVITLTLSTSTLFTALKVISGKYPPSRLGLETRPTDFNCASETIEGPRGAEEVDKIFGVLENAPSYMEKIPTAEQDADVVVQGIQYANSKWGSQ